MPRKETYSGPISAQAQQDLVSEGIENFELPKSVVMKIAKSALPDNVKLQKETVLSLVKGSTVFINYLAAIAHDVAQSKQHKSISASDVLKALETIEFGDMVGKLQNELNIYRDVSKTDKGKKGNTNGTSSSAKKVSASASAGPSSSSILPVSASAPAPASASASASAPMKGKGKERATAGNHPLPPPFTSAPLATNHHHPHPRGVGVADLSESAMDVDDDESGVSVSVSVGGVGAGRDNDEGDEGEGEGEGQDEDSDQEQDEEEEEEELVELVDMAAIEEQELRKDKKALELEHSDSEIDW